VSRYDWLLFLHVLSAFSLVAAEVLVTLLIVGGWKLELPSEISRVFRLSRFGDVLFGVGAVGTILIGIWLAIDLDEYKLWDGWVIAGLVLWAVLMGVGGRTARFYYAARDRARALVSEGRDVPSPELTAILRSPTGLALHVATVVLVLLLFIDMIYKPGA
jgi:uncharacterized membrane protein